jgi:oligoribonuclease NrnB/cAMP/cGMP phosphodiesterase (DHH superfamily)
VKILYHDDMDGRAGAAIILRASVDAKCLPMVYARDVPFHEIEKDEHVIIIDFSLQKPGDWQKLLAITEDVVWIDHHQTAIDKSDEIPEVRKLRGIRCSGQAGCLLAWRWVYDEEEPPLYLKLISDRDVWAWEHGTMTAYFHAGAGLQDTKPESQWWDYIASSNSEHGAAMAETLKAGEVVVKFKQEFYDDLRGAISFQTEIDGHEAIAMNVARTGSEGFGFKDGWKGALPDEWPILMPFYWDGDKWTISLYSKTIDVSEIAKKYGGGGHKGAAGFQAVEMPEFLRA